MVVVYSNYIKSVDLFLSFSCTPHIALTMDQFVLCKIQISPYFGHHASLPYSVAGLIYTFLYINSLKITKHNLNIRVGSVYVYNIVDG